MDEQEILSHLDARGRAAASGTHAVLASGPVPDFDPDRVAVALAPGDRPGRRWAVAVAVAAAVLVVVGVAVVLAGRDGDGPVVEGGAVRRFIATHLPDGMVPSSLSDGPVDRAGALPAEVYGPAGEPRIAVGIEPDEISPGVGYAPEGEDETWEAATFGDRPGHHMIDPELLGWYGVRVTVDGHPVVIFGGEEDRPAVEQVAATVELDDGTVAAGSPALPPGWEHQGQVRDLLDLLVSAWRGGGRGYHVTYQATIPGDVSEVTFEDVRFVTVSTTSGGEIDVRALPVIPMPGWQQEEVTVRGRAALLVGQTPEDVELWGEFWQVSWVESPGEVIRVGGTGVGRDELLAVAEGIRPASDAEWAELARASLRFSMTADHEVVLGEGTFGDGSPWLLLALSSGVAPASGDDGVEGETASTVVAQEEKIGGSGGGGDVGAPIPPEPGGDPPPMAVLRTTALSHTGVSAGWSETNPGGGGAPPAGFVDGVSVSRGDAFGWAYGLVTAEVATVELVGVDGRVLGRAEVLSAGGFHGWVLELPRGMGAQDDPDWGQEATSGADGGLAPPTTVVGGESGPEDGPVVVARSADGAELARLPVP